MQIKRPAGGGIHLDPAQKKEFHGKHQNRMPNGNRTEGNEKDNAKKKSESRHLGGEPQKKTLKFSREEESLLRQEKQLPLSGEAKKPDHGKSSFM